MSHFAKIVNGVVHQVIVADQDFVDSLDGQWVQTSFNTRGGLYYDNTTGQPSADQSKSLRKNFASVGFVYDAANDAFIPPKPERNPSFVLDKDAFIWVPPIAKPSGDYAWDESAGKWVSYTPTKFDVEIAALENSMRPPNNSSK